MNARLAVVGSKSKHPFAKWFCSGMCRRTGVSLGRLCTTLGPDETRTGSSDFEGVPLEAASQSSGSIR